MEQKKKEQDVLIVRDEKTGEIGVVAGLKRDGTPNHESRQSGKRAGFPAFRPPRRRVGQLLRQLLPPMQGAETLRFLPHRGRGCGQGHGSIERAAEEPEAERGAARPAQGRYGQVRAGRRAAADAAGGRNVIRPHRTKGRDTASGRTAALRGTEQRRGLQAHRRQPPRP